MQRRDFLATVAAGGALSVGRAVSLAAGNDIAATRKREPQTDVEIFSGGELKPTGKYFEATVPDTLDLAERGRLAVKGLLNFLDPSQSYELYQMGSFNTNPPYMSHYGSVACNWGKVTEGILMTRHMSGSTENLDKEEEMFKGILRLVRDNGEFAVDSSNSWVWDSQPNNTLIPANTSRMLLAFLVQNQIRPSARLTQLISRMTDSICNDAQVQGDYADLPGSIKPPWGILGNFQFMWDQGESLRGVVRAYALTGDRKYLEMGGKLTKALLRPEYWEPEAAPKAVTGGEHGQFAGHIHSYAQALMAMIWYANLTNDAHLKEFVRESYEYLRTFGIARIGMYGEMCATGDMTYLAIKLSDAGVGDYWEDVDQYVRNQLTEQQMIDAEKMHRVVATMPKLVEMKLPEYAKRGATTDGVIDRFVGAYLSDASNPTLIYPQNFQFVVCCSGNCPPALYGAWEGTTRYHAGVAQVNLLLNRVSPWLDMDSYLPYEGKVVIRNKTSEKLFVRIPRWVDNEKVRVEVNGKRGERVWVGRYLFLEGVRAGDQVRIHFPVVESKETYKLKWKAQDGWLETTSPGDSWKAYPTPDEFTFTFKGNTVVDVTPRGQGAGYPVYQRDRYKAATAPQKEVTRYVSPVVVKW